MAFWAASGRFANAGFLCVCVDPDALGTAKDFARNYFAGAPATLINGYIDSRADFPNFQAQLGCQGFIIFDAAGQLKVQCTLPWMQQREAAFRDVESKLRLVLPPPSLPIGKRARVTGLTSAKGLALNGQVGAVTGVDNGRCFVLLDGTEEPVAVRPENLEDPMVGRHVRVSGLTSTKGSALNGQVGKVVGSTENARLLVEFAGGTIALRPENLQEVDDPGEIPQESTEVLAPLASVPSVHDKAMDEEHSQCIDALNALIESLSVPALRRVREELAAHFEHEETEMKRAGFGNGSQAPSAMGLSALDSHIKDHRRIVSLADEALDRLQRACDSCEGAVPKTSVADIVKGFVEHATLYDALYVGKLAPSAA